MSSPPASDKYGLLFGSLYSMWLRIKLTFMKTSFPAETFPNVLRSVLMGMKMRFSFPLYNYFKIDSECNLKSSQVSIANSDRKSI